VPASKTNVRRGSPGTPYTMSAKAIQHEGKSFPLGSTLVPGGANFSVFAKHSAGAQLLLFDDIDAPKPSRVIDLDPRSNRTYHYWHAFVPGVTAGQIYAYRIVGPFDPVRGLRFDPNKVLLDPYGKCIARPAGRSREAARHPGDNAATALRNVVVDPSTYDWEGDAPLGRPFAKTIIYEMHVGGFTRHPNSGVAPGRRGTYTGLIDKIPYFAGTWNQRRRAAADLCLRRAGRSAGPRQLLGLSASVVFRAT